MATDSRRYRCRYCSHIYDEALGDPDGGIAPGTRYEDIPDDWICPECGAAKSDYELIED
ncbi:MAG: rubredoxin [Stenotrophobium sp.]